MHEPQGSYHLRCSVGLRGGVSKAKGQLPHLPGQEGAAPIGQDRLEPPPPRASLSMSSNLRRALSKPPMRCHVCPAGGLWTVQTADYGATKGTQSQPNGHPTLNTTSGPGTWEPRLVTSTQDALERGLDGHMPGPRPVPPHTWLSAACRSGLGGPMVPALAPHGNEGWGEAGLRLCAPCPPSCAVLGNMAWPEPSTGRSCFLHRCCLCPTRGRRRGAVDSRGQALRVPSPLGCTRQGPSAEAGMQVTHLGPPGNAYEEEPTQTEENQKQKGRLSHVQSLGHAQVRATGSLSSPDPPPHPHG